MGYRRRDAGRWRLYDRLTKKIHIFLDNLVKGGLAEKQRIPNTISIIWEGI